MSLYLSVLTEDTVKLKLILNIIICVFWNTLSLVNCCMFITYLDHFQFLCLPPNLLALPLFYLVFYFPSFYFYFFIFEISHVRETLRCLTFCIWLISPNIMISNSNHHPETMWFHSSLWLNSIPLLIYTTFLSFTCWWVYWMFLDLSIVNCTDMHVSQ